MKIRVMPDYCSTGLWDESGCNIDPPEYVPEILKMALKYWHCTWEFCQDEDFNSTMSEWFERDWVRHGKVLAEELTEASDGLDQYEFTL